MRLSVVVPVHNRAGLLPITLRSLLAQHRVADEILVIDDGSSDGSAEIAEAFGHPVKVIRQDNQGPGSARNRGLADAQGEFIHFFDSDDLALPNLHAAQLQTLEECNGDIAYSPWLKCRLSQINGITPTNHIFQAGGMPRGSLIRALLTNWSTVPISWLVRRSCLEKSGGFSTDLCCGEDQLLFLSLLLDGAHVIHTPSTLVLYRDEAHQTLSRPSTEKAQRRHALDWAQALIRAHSLCLIHGIDPICWFGFRRRVYVAWQALRDIANPPTELMHQLKEIFSSWRSPDLSYVLSRTFQQKGDGLTAHLLGRRAHRTFRSAPLSAPHQQLFSEFVTSLYS